MKNIPAVLALSLAACDNGNMSSAEAVALGHISPEDANALTKHGDTYIRDCELAMRDTHITAVDLQLKDVKTQERKIVLDINDADASGLIDHRTAGLLIREIESYADTVGVLLDKPNRIYQGSPGYESEANLMQMGAQERIKTEQEVAALSLPKNCDFTATWQCTTTEDGYPIAWTGVDGDYFLRCDEE